MCYQCGKYLFLQLFILYLIKVLDKSIIVLIFVSHNNKRQTIMKTTATYTGKQYKGITVSHRKENSFQESYLVLAVVNGKIETVIDCRMYGTNAKNYCCLWVHRKDEFFSGSGSAGGYGYHRPSAAAQEAINNAGYKLNEDIAGRGDGAIENALQGIAALEGYEAVQIIKAHG